MMNNIESWFRNNMLSSGTEQVESEKESTVEQVGGESIDAPREFEPLTYQELIDILGLTIKQDEINKLVTFLCELSAYTNDSQFNISFNAPSSTGKSYIPTEIAQLFPQEDVTEIAYCSPTAFFHDVGAPDPTKKGRIIVDLSRKILIFLDQPHNELLARLRPLLSHDKREITVKITDKSQKQGLRTKEITLRGFPSVIFCTAGLSIDEQEATRFLLLSPEINQEKIREGILTTITKEVDGENYKKWLEEKPERTLLKERIQAIKAENIKDIRISKQDKETIVKRFFEQNQMLRPRHQRDIKRLLSLIKSFALLNLWWRKQDEAVIFANQEDVDHAFTVWEKLSYSQELNLPPYVYGLYEKIIVPVFEKKNGDKSERIGITRLELASEHYKVYGNILSNVQLRQQILPMLETAGLITQEDDPNNRRQKLIYPTTQDTVSMKNGNSENGGGVIEVDDIPF